MPMITVKTRGETRAFRRAGRTFTAVPTEIDSADLTPDQIEQLRREGGEGGSLEVTGLPGSVVTAEAPRANAPTLGGGQGSASPSKAEVQSSGLDGAIEHERERVIGRRGK